MIFNSQEKEYPSIFLPKRIKEFIENGFTDTELREGLGFQKPKKETFVKPKYHSFYKPLQLKIHDLLVFNDESIHKDLENHDFYLGEYLLPRKPSFYYTTEVEYKALGFKTDEFLKNSFIIILVLHFIIFLASSVLLPIFFDFEQRRNISVFAIVSIASFGIYFAFLFLLFVRNKFSIYVSKTREELTFKEKYRRTDLLRNYNAKIQAIIDLQEQDFQTKNQEFSKERCVRELDLLKQRNGNDTLNLVDNRNSKKGKSELMFLKYLYDEFGKNVLTDYSPNIGKNPFQPDFIVYDDDIDFHIDIEIDEPYSFDTGDTIHHDRTKDAKRNLFFNEINWGVIRFSEKQIVTEPKKCCQLIQNTLKAIKGKQNYIEHTITKEPFWSHEEALIMKLNDYRNRY
ncbi:hypothetical protein A9200_18165 [Maribacter hydrothermalis]|uniref:DUF559 domain-containing protein n=1 Tax=Maribacter hydrothermalis TaxID=1836467 RepID=A0A1B7Z622_9FLAO|nr:hypothetical protein A9200_18165 [Maribacter hydrothermalis]